MVKSNNTEVSLSNCPLVIHLGLSMITCRWWGSNKGFIDKYYGDGIMALFPNHPNDAVKASLEMIAALEKFNQTNVAIYKVHSHPFAIWNVKKVGAFKPKV